MQRIELKTRSNPYHMNLAETQLLSTQLPLSSILNPETLYFHVPHHGTFSSMGDAGSIGIETHEKHFNCTTAAYHRLFEWLP